MEKNVLTPSQVKKLGLDKVSVITADMLEGYTRIGEYAFEYCGVLTSVTIPDSVTSIGGKAFSGCNNLTSIEIPNTVTSIGDCAFYNCYALTSLNIPNSVIDIGEAAFYSCKSLTSVVIPDSVTHIGTDAFRGCISLASVTIGNNVTYIGRDAFWDCNFKYKKEKDNQGRIIAYKEFNADMTCMDFHYKEGETYEIKDEPVLCRYGFHACLNPFDCFGYYSGEIGKNVVFHEVYLEGVLDMKCDDSKIVTNKITIGREITISEMADIASGRK